MPADSPFPAWLRRHVRERPDATAWHTEEGERIAWSALAERMASRAAQLARRTRPDRPLAVVLARRSALLFETLAAFQAGRRVLPLHPQPPTHLRPLFEVAGVTQAIADCDSVLPENVQRLDPFGGDAGMPSESGSTGTGAELWLATSGSGGKPHIVCHTPETLAASVAASREALALTGADRWLHCLPADHAGGLMIALRALATGARVRFLDGFDPGQVRTVLETEAVTHLSLVPAQLHRLLEVLPGPAPAALRCVLVGGGPLSEPLAGEARARGWPLVVTWGMTETASHVALCRVDRHWRPGCIGRPVPGVRIALDRTDPDTGIGRLTVCGPMVARGYLGGPVLPACEQGRRIVTRDLGRRGADGMLELAGRADAVLNTGGRLLDPERLEAELAHCPGLEMAGVTGIEDPVWGELVTLLYVGEPNEEALDAWCRERLPAWMRPRRFLRVPDLPRTRTGKLDRPALRRLAERYR